MSKFAFPLLILNATELHGWKLKCKILYIKMGICLKRIDKLVRCQMCPVRISKDTVGFFLQRETVAMVTSRLHLSTPFRIVTIPKGTMKEFQLGQTVPYLKDCQLKKKGMLSPVLSEINVLSYREFFFKKYLKY